VIIMMNFKGFERLGLRSNLSSILAFAWRDWGNHEKPYLG
jgi:hypothetical protein